MSQIYTPGDAWQALRGGLPELLRARAPPLLMPVATAEALQGAIANARDGEDLQTQS